MHCSELEDARAREWNEALSLVACGKDIDFEGHFEEKGSLIVDLNKWKVVWGKKPEQYRLKPYLMWSIDELPVLVEETCPTEDPIEKPDSCLIKKDKQARALKKKIIRINRKLDKLNKTFLEQDASKNNEGGASQWRSLPDVLRSELLAERSVVKDKLRRLTNEIANIKSKGTEDVKVDKSCNRGQIILKTSDSLEEFTPKCECNDGIGMTKEELVRGKCGKNAAAMGRSKSEPNDSNLENKTKKKRFCRKHYKKTIQGCKQGETAAQITLVTSKRTTSAQLSKVRFDIEEKLEDNFVENKIGREGDFSNFPPGKSSGKETEKRKRTCETHNRTKSNRMVDSLDLSTKTKEEFNCRLAMKPVRSKTPSKDVLLKSHQMDSSSNFKMKKSAANHKSKCHSGSFAKSMDHNDQAVAD